VVIAGKSADMKLGESAILLVLVFCVVRAEVRECSPTENPADGQSACAPTLTEDSLPQSWDSATDDKSTVEGEPQSLQEPLPEKPEPPPEELLLLDSLSTDDTRTYIILLEYVRCVYEQN